MRRKKTSSKRKPLLIIAMVLVAVSIVGVGWFYYGSGDSVLINDIIYYPQTGYTQFSAIGGCTPLDLETSCSIDADCLNSMPSDMPGNIEDVATVSCLNAKCFITYDTCGEGIYEP